MQDMQDPTIKDLLNWFFIAQIAVSLAFIIFGLFSKKIRSFISRILTVIILFVIFLLLLGIVKITPGLEDLKKMLVQGLPIVFMLIWCIIVPLATFSFIKNLFYSRFTGTILFLGKPDDDRNSLFAGPIVICTFIGLIIGYILLTNAGSFSTGIMLFASAAGVLVIILAIYIFLVALGKISKNDVFSSVLSFYFIISFPILILLSWNVMMNSEVSGVNYLILAFSLIYTSQGVFKRTDITAIEEKYPENESLTKKELKKLEKERNKDDPFFISKIIRFIGSEGLVFILLGSLLGYYLLRLQLSTDVEVDLLNQLTGGGQNVSIIYMSLQVFMIAFIIIFLSLSYLVSGRIRRYFKPVHYKIGFLPPYDQLKETLEGLKTGEIDWKTFVAGSGFKLAIGGVKAGATGTVKAGEAVLSGVTNLFRRDKKKNDK
jgi:hypothetical protein